MSNANEPWYQRAWEWVEAEFGKAPAIEAEAKVIEHSIGIFADKVTNEVKILQGNQIVQFLETGVVTIATMIDPALLPLVAGLQTELPVILNIVSGIPAEMEKPLTDQVRDAIAKIQSIKGVNGSVYAGWLGTLSAAIAAFVNGAAGIEVSPAKLLINQQLVHTQTAAPAPVSGAAPAEDKNTGAVDPGAHVGNDSPTEGTAWPAGDSNVAARHTGPAAPDGEVTAADIEAGNTGN